MHNPMSPANRFVTTVSAVMFVLIAPGVIAHRNVLCLDEI
jgi:NADH:ubiquinone oxidoreductase subunit K